MTALPTAPTADRTAVPTMRVPRAYAPLIGLVTLLILLQSVEAGVFLQGPDRDAYSSWIDIHGAGADLLLALSLVTAVVAVRGLKGRRDLVIGSVALFFVLLLESGLGHLINGSIGGSDHDGATIIHIPLALAIISLTVWLATQAAQLRRGALSSR